MGAQTWKSTGRVLLLTVIGCTGYCYNTTDWAEQAPDAQYPFSTSIASSHGISVYSATKLGGQCNMTCWYIGSYLSMNFSYPQPRLTIFGIPCTQLHSYVGGQWQQKQWYEVHTKIGMISLFTLSIPKTV